MNTVRLTIDSSHEYEDAASHESNYHSGTYLTCHSGGDVESIGNDSSAYNSEDGSEYTGIDD